LEGANDEHGFEPRKLHPLLYAVRYRSLEECLLFDNVSLQTDNSDLLLNIHASAVDICWAGFTNQMYQVQYRTNASGTNWFNLGVPTQGTGTNCITDWIYASQQKHYRIIRVS
jgi:hypothetical protein